MDYYYYSYIGSILCFTSHLLVGFIGYEVGLDGHRRRISRDNNIMINDQRSEKINN
jgi:hypothetical protein